MVAAWAATAVAAVAERMVVATAKREAAAAAVVEADARAVAALAAAATAATAVRPCCRFFHKRLRFRHSQVLKNPGSCPGSCCKTDTVSRRVAADDSRTIGERSVGIIGHPCTFGSITRVPRRELDRLRSLDYNAFRLHDKTCR